LCSLIFLQALCAILLGNLACLLLQYHLPLPTHHPFQMDPGLIVDFFSVFLSIP
jgi:hypothetical protein